MKKVILAAALLITVSSSFAVNYTNANTVTQQINAKRPRPIPQPCIDSYNAMYPGATTIKWARKGEGVYQVTFLYGGEKMTARYAADGTYLGK
jgi:hypothetical protein